MSRAFVREDDTRAHEPELPEDDTPAPITPAGMEHLRARLAALSADPSQTRVAQHLARRIERLTVVREAPDDGRVLFGATVTLEDDDGEELTYRLVGPDETALHANGISIASPVARALLGRRAGDTVHLPRPRGALEVTIVRVQYG